MKKFLILISLFLTILGNSAVFAKVYTEDFEDGVLDAPWVVGSGDYVISNGELQIINGYDNGKFIGADVSLHLSNQELIDFISADIRAAATTNQFVGLTHQWFDQDGTGLQIYYKMHVPSQSISATLFYQEMGVGVTVIGSQNLGSIDPAEKNTLSINIHNNYVTVGLNGVNTDIFSGLYYLPSNLDENSAYVHAHDVSSETDLNFYIDNLEANSYPITIPNQPPTAPELISPVNSATDVNPKNIVFEWNPSSDPDGDQIYYFIKIQDNSGYDIYNSNEEGVIITDASFNFPVILGPGVEYRWTVWAEDAQHNESPENSWWSFTTAFPFEHLDNLFNFSWVDAGVATHEESLFSILWNCKHDPNYTYLVELEDGRIVGIKSEANNFLRDHAGETETNIITYIENYEFVNWTTGNFISPWLDGHWNNEISNDSHFNTVHRGTPGPNEPFEVISYVDEFSPICGSSNINSYFFSYDSKYDTPEKNDSELATFGAWINYLQAIVNDYNQPIDTLTIFAHGAPGEVKMSEAFHMRNDEYTKTWMKALKWNENTQTGILSNNSTILLFSCEVGQTLEGKMFVRELANWTGATVYANTEYTGGLHTEDSRIISDWELDVVAVPDNKVCNPDDDSYPEDHPCKQTYTFTLGSYYDYSFLLPGGVGIKISADAITIEPGQEGILEISPVNNTELDSRGIDLGNNLNVSAYDITFENVSINSGEYIEVALPLNLAAANWQIDEENIMVQYWDGETAAWSNEGVWDVHFLGDSVYFKTNHTSVFSVLAYNKTFRSNLGNNPRPRILDIDVFTFNGTEGEDVVITLDPNELGDFTGNRATLILFDQIRRAWLFKMDRSNLPNSITATLPATGQYIITVAEQPKLAKWNSFSGDYSLTMDSSQSAWKTFEATYWVE